MDWLYNSWVVGIGGGVLSGVFVTFISRMVFSRRDRREYVQKLLLANREVIYAIRPGISDGHIPGQRIVESLINATARKYAVDKGDMYGPTQVGEELTKEIMDSSFISASTKQQYCDQLECLAPARPGPSQEMDAVREAKSTSKSHLEEYRSRMVAMMSVMLGLMSSMMTFVLVFSPQFSRKLDTWSSASESLKMFVPVVITLLTTMLVVIVTLLARRLHWLAGKMDTSIGRHEDIEATKENPSAAHNGIQSTTQRNEADPPSWAPASNTYNRV